MAVDYVHGYSTKESIRLQDQASTLAELLHVDTIYPPGSRILEAGCGVGAQTLTLAANSPGALITAVDISETSVTEVARTIAAAGIANVLFKQADIFDLPFSPQSFDHVFLCFVLEHQSQPVQALNALQQILKPDGTNTVIEGDHGSAFFYPDSEFARRAVACQVRLQQKSGGNALIGRALYPLLRHAGFQAVHVSPQMVYADAGRPEMVEGFTKKTFTAMIEGIRKSALAAGLVSEPDFDRGVADLYRTAESDGVFCYTFFKAVAINPGEVAAGPGEA